MCDYLVVPTCCLPSWACACWHQPAGSRERDPSNKGGRKPKGPKTCKKDAETPYHKFDFELVGIAGDVVELFVGSIPLFLPFEPEHIIGVPEQVREMRRVPRACLMRAPTISKGRGKRRVQDPAAHVINDVGMRDAPVSYKQRRGSRQGPLCTGICEAAQHALCTASRGNMSLCTAIREAAHTLCTAIGKAAGITGTGHMLKARNRGRNT